MSKIKNILLLLFSFIIYIKYYDELQSVIAEYESNLIQLKLISCLNLVHSYLAQRDGDQKLKKMIKNSNLPHDKLYTKFIASSIKKCSDKITSNQINYLLTPENIDNYNTLNSSITNLIKVEEEIKNLELTKEEENIYDKISERIFESENKTKKKIKKRFFQKYKTIIIAIIIIIGSYLFYRKYFKKETKAVKKEKYEKELNKKFNEKRKNNKYIFRNIF